MRRKWLPTLAVGLLGGFALGVAARAWMRLISEDPEFTWSGTLFIVLGFTVFGLAQSVVAVARSRSLRRWQLVSVRVLGGVFMLPLFVAAGGLMMPTVIGAGLGSARVRWHPIARTIMFLIAAAPVLFVSRDLIDSFGWSLHAASGIAVMLLIYAIIVRATYFIFAARETTPTT